MSFNTNNDWTQGSLSFTGTDGTDITAFGRLYDDALPNPNFSGDPYIASWAGSSGGIGICSGDSSVNTNTNSTASCHDDHQVDGYGTNEAVIVDFGLHRVKLLSITFAYVGDNDDYEVFLLSSDGYNINLPLPNNCWVCKVTNFNLASDTAFAFGAYGHDDDWKLQGLKYTKVGVVPLPATAWMLLASIGGFAFMRRRKRLAMV